jgi:hypothetical protein
VRTIANVINAVAGLQGMEAAGLLAVGRAAEILA